MDGVAGGGELPPGPQGRDGRGVDKDQMVHAAASRFSEDEDEDVDQIRALVETAGRAVALVTGGELDAADWTEIPDGMRSTTRVAKAPSFGHINR